MRHLFIQCLLALCTITYLNASVLPSGDKDFGKIVTIKSQEDIIIIDYLRAGDLDTKRPINIYNAKGKCIFKTKANKREKVSEINMAQLKAGIYVVETIVDGNTIKMEFSKD